MNVRRYKSEDFKQISQWAERRGESYQADLLPPTGFIVDNVAAYFLYSTPSRVCFLENMIANPDSDPAERSEALSMIVDAILSEAKERGFQVAYACTNIPAVVQRALTAGATFKPKYVLLTKNLS